MKESANHTIVHRWYTWSFVMILSGLCLLFFILPKQTFSELENRTLQAFPSFSFEKLFNGSFTKDTEIFITDHFPYRKQWVAAKSIMEQGRLQQENNQIYLGKEGYLLEKLEEPDWEKLTSYIEAINLFAVNNSHNKITMLLAPTSIGINADKMPWLAQSFPQASIHSFIKEKLTSETSFLDGLSILDSAPKDGRQLFYKTDHHWTTYGAYVAYEAYAKQMGWQPKRESDFQIQTVTKQFLGSFHTRSLFSGVKPDTIEAYIPLQPHQYDIYIADDDTKTDSLYDPAYLDKKDKYSYFQGGVHALMTITTNLSDDEVDLDSLLVIKDSYAHSMLPFLAEHVRNIHVIDIRYYNGPISKYMEQEQIEQALLLFNSTTFASEQNLLKLKY